MISPLQLTQGVEWVWLVWLAAVAVVLRMGWLTLRNWRRPNWAELARGEEGVSYSLSYVLVIPFFFLFVCIVFETTWLLMAKIGTLIAAHAGARSAVVWSSAQPANLRTTRINQSVWTAMTPFITGSPDGLNVPGDAFAQSGEYAWAYQSYFSSGDPYANAPFATMARRYLATASRTSWRTQVDNSRPDGGLTAIVTYRAPLHIPGAGRILDPDGSPPYEYPITSSATLPNEAPANDSRTLGIDYQSR
jgi:Flp pilus assembly protein TadG